MHDATSAADGLEAPAANETARAAGTNPYPRAAARVTIEFFLRQVETVSRVVEGDFFLGLVLTAMGSANVWRVARSSEMTERYSGLDEPVPDAIKTPISVSALAASLGLPYETARRYVGKLAQKGMCVKTNSGWIVPTDFVGAEQGRAIVEHNMAQLRQFILALRAAGVDVDAIK